MKSSQLKKIIREEINTCLKEVYSKRWQPKSRLDTSLFIEPDEMEQTLSDIYHIISGNRRDYLNIPDSLINELKKLADNIQ